MYENSQANLLQLQSDYDQLSRRKEQAENTQEASHPEESAVAQAPPQVAR